MNHSTLFYFFYRLASSAQRCVGGKVRMIPIAMFTNKCCERKTKTALPVDMFINSVGVTKNWPSLYH